MRPRKNFCGDAYNNTASYPLIFLMDIVIIRYYIEKT